EPLFVDALIHLEALLGREDVYVLETRLSFAEGMFESQEYIRGMALLYECFDSAHGQWGDDHAMTIRVMGDIGIRLCNGLGRLVEAATWLERANDASTRLYSNMEGHHTMLVRYLTTCYIRQGRFAQATAIARSIYDQERRTRGPDNHFTHSARRLMCLCLRNQGCYDNVDTDVRTCIEYYESVDDEYQVVQCRKILGDFYLATGEFARARVELDGLLGKYQKYVGSTSSTMRSVLYSCLLLEAFNNVVPASMEILSGLENDVINSGISSETWLDFECHGCYEPIQGWLHLCPDCPRNSLRVCHACVQTNKAKSLCSHDPTPRDWIRVSPPMRFLQEQQLALLAKSKDWVTYALVHQAYKDYCNQHEVPVEELVDDLAPKIALFGSCRLGFVWAAGAASVCLVTLGLWRTRR
ncbi:hypothetical protein As57867_004039, partial [Aphanomyces stellatus]